MNTSTKSLNEEAELTGLSEMDLAGLMSVPLHTLTRAHYLGVPRRGHRSDASFWGCRSCTRDLAALQNLGVRVVRADGSALRAPGAAAEVR